MPTASQVIAKFASDLRYDAIPQAVIERAKHCVMDTTAAAMFGGRLPWSRMVVDYARRYGSGGACSIIGAPGNRVHAPCAALANGVLAHAFEQDDTRDPSVGAHGGATLLPAVLAACEETGADGKTALAAYVAGTEVLFRLAVATHDARIPPESIGFHVPGITGPYGAAVAAGRVYGLTADQMTHALGIAGSLSSGLLAFTKSKQGGMVKRLHLGRVAESGILAARLAAQGYTGPETVLDGKFGLLEVDRRDADSALLTADLYNNWETLCIGMKRYPFHMTAQTPVQTIRDLMSEHAFAGADVATIVVEGAAKLVSHNNITEPGDIMQAQYSVPFCVAFALFRDPEDPLSFDDSALDDAAIRAVCRNVDLRAFIEPRPSFKTTRLTVKLKNGLEFVRESSTYKGMPSNPLSREDLRRKFMLLTTDAGVAAAARLFERLENLESEPLFSFSCPRE